MAITIASMAAATTPRMMRVELELIRDFIVFFSDIIVLYFSLQRYLLHVSGTVDLSRSRYQREQRRAEMISRQIDVSCEQYNHNSG